MKVDVPNLPISEQAEHNGLTANHTAGQDNRDSLGESL